jgi:CheY-like chemotaxis protein
MPIAQQISPHIPYLRRYARALSGSQKSGDAYVAALLESLLQDSSAFPGDMEPRVALYHAFANLWKSVRINSERSQAADPDQRHTVDAKLEVMTPLARQAFLLMTVEEFPIADTAKILGVSEGEASTLITQAGREIAEQVATDVLIIEDEPIIAMDIEQLVRSLGHSVTAVARTQAEAVAAAERRRPGMVLADIQLADGSSGIDAVNEILTAFKVPVIFITAYPERLLTGERPEPTFLITKPFQPEIVKAVISQALFFDAKAVASRVRAAE